VRAIVVCFVRLFDFVGLVYRVDGLLHIPEAAYVSVVLILNRQKERDLLVNGGVLS
jgi:hypothetical protein